MALNCKPGDMAIVVGGGISGANVGKVVTCIELLPRDAHNVRDEFGSIWKVNRMMKFQNLFGEVIERPFAPDKYLMPIRPGDDVSADTKEPITVSEPGDARGSD